MAELIARSFVKNYDKLLQKIDAMNLMDVKHLIEQMIDSAKEYLHSI